MSLTLAGVRKSRIPEQGPIGRAAFPARRSRWLPTVTVVVTLSAGFLGACTQAPLEESESAPPLDRAAELRAGREADGRFNLCMEERGFVIDRHPDGSVTISAAPGDTSGTLTHEAAEECQEEAGYPQIAPLSDDELKTLYQSSLETLDCLKEQGFSPQEPDSWERFLEEWQAKVGGSDLTPWSPYDGVVDLPGALRACPEPQPWDADEG